TFVSPARARRRAARIPDPVPGRAGEKHSLAGDARAPRDRRARDLPHRPTLRAQKPAGAVLMAPWIELEEVSLARGSRMVLRSISASLGGQAIGLVGANGAGKSTLIGALLGVLRAQRGRIRVLGLELPQHALEVRTRAGVMAEQAGIFPGG